MFIGECILVSNAFNYTWYFIQTDGQCNAICKQVTCFLKADYVVSYFLEHDQILSELSHEKISEIDFLVHYMKDLKANC